MGAISTLVILALCLVVFVYWIAVVKNEFDAQDEWEDE